MTQGLPWVFVVSWSRFSFLEVPGLSAVFLAEVEAGSVCSRLGPPRTAGRMLRSYFGGFPEWHSSEFPAVTAEKLLQVVYETTFDPKEDAE